MNKLNILYEDNHIIVVEKPVNILSQSDNTGDLDLLTMVKDYVKEKYNKPGNVYIGLVHRLDRVVGGIMVFARTSKAAKRLNEEIKNHNFTKQYLTLVKGIVENKKGTLENYLYKDEKTGKSMVVDKNHPNSKKAILNYEVIDYVNNNSLVKVDLKTGRHHQIRLQFLNINHPIVGDKRYNNDDNKVMHLYSYYLSFNHPVKKEKMEFKLLPKWEEINNETIIHRL